MFTTSDYESRGLLDLRFERLDQSALCMFMVILCVIFKSLGVKGSQSAILYSLGGSYPFYPCTISITEIITFIFMYNIRYLKLTLLNSILNLILCLWLGPLRLNGGFLLLSIQLYILLSHYLCFVFFLFLNCLY